jgi:predicted metalloprotease
MRWDEFRQSENVEDRRGLGVRAGGLGIGTIIVLALIGWALGIDPRILIGGAELVTSSGPSYEQSTSPRPEIRTGTPEDQMGKFVSAVLGETEDRWTDIFKAGGKTYQAPRLVMYSGVVGSACGTAESAMGPFYCPNDQRVYLDTSFFQQIETRFRGCDVGSKACQFSQAYVIAHEVGHHVQNLLGILPRARQLQASLDKASANQVQVRVELQADCLAGVWANRSQQKWKFLEPGDIDAAMQTASAIGDDTLQRRTQGYVVPDAFTHGTAQQRKSWFTTGLTTGTVESCNTFGAARQ